ncbi:hypothetical protein D4764_0214280 [Takifugu flavidus]|uniref:Uncharacterized protein n=1 Tax=Takifugu flavidus TaxID=433684 RepID=A0A5C6MGR0_9TELE|nr:hypothetical protein D4764_0214280 [Takifugu flavidus]
MALRERELEKESPSSPLSRAADAPFLSTPEGAENAHLDLSLPVDKALIKREQESDPSLAKCRVAATKNMCSQAVGLFQNGI